ncbi:Putative LOC100120931, partial [Caligus rogercresseyi]
VTTCKAYNSLGSILSPIEFNCFNASSDKASTCEIQKREIEEELQTYELSCEIPGRSNEDGFLWYFNGDPVHNARAANESTFLAKEFGYYTCAAGDFSGETCTIYINEKFFISEDMYFLLLLGLLSLIAVFLLIIFVVQRLSNNFDNNIANSDINSLIHDVESKPRRNVILRDNRHTEQIWLV